MSEFAERLQAQRQRLQNHNKGSQRNEEIEKLLLASICRDARWSTRKRKMMGH